VKNERFACSSSSRPSTRLLELMRAGSCDRSWWAGGFGGRIWGEDLVGGFQICWEGMSMGGFVMTTANSTRGVINIVLIPDKYPTKTRELTIIKLFSGKAGITINIG
jgi:hypothetical protein